jgi:phage baseplate assembly protein gpV
MYDILVGMKSDIESLKTNFGNMLKVGPVSHVDAKKGYRVNMGLGTDGNPMLSPWYPHPESGGSTQSWSPLTVGQIVGILHPIGDHRQGILLRAGFSDKNPQPSEDMDANVLKAHGVTMTMKGGKLKIEGNVEFVGGYVKHNGHAIDDTHKHTDVMPGGALTGTPE